MNENCLAGFVLWRNSGERAVEFLLLGQSWMTPEMDEARSEFIAKWKEERNVR